MSTRQEKTGAHRPTSHVRRSTQASNAGLGAFSASGPEGAHAWPGSCWRAAVVQDAIYTAHAIESSRLSVDRPLSCAVGRWVSRL